MMFNHFATAELNGKPVMTEQDFNKLLSEGYITQTRLEHFDIKKMYRELHTGGLRAGDCVDKIREKYPHLQFDTIRKIIYDQDLRRR